ncbi:MAG TPA: type II toxin-antitoxin system VapB family antitoxin [Bosea sp. (in: a-proteobacteria)]
MSVLIKDAETDRLIRDVANRTGETMTQAVRTAMQERLARLPPTQNAGRLDMAKIEAFLAEIDAMPKINTDLTDDEIIGYDENGVPK